MRQARPRSNEMKFEWDFTKLLTHRSVAGSTAVHFVMCDPLGRVRHLAGGFTIAHDQCLDHLTSRHAWPQGSAPVPGKRLERSGRGVGLRIT